MPPTRPVSIGCITITRSREAFSPPTGLLANSLPRAWPSVCVQLPSLRVAPDTVQPPPEESTCVPPTCQTPSFVRAAARTGLACSSLKRRPRLASVASGWYSSTLRIGLRSTKTTMVSTSGRPSADTLIGTFIGSSAKAGPRTCTRSSNTTLAVPKNSRFRSGHCSEPKGSSPASACAAAHTTLAASRVRTARRLGMPGIVAARAQRFQSGGTPGTAPERISALSPRSRSPAR